MMAGAAASASAQSRIAVLKFTSHPALDELEAGFLASFDSLMRADSRLRALAIDKYNAYGNPQTAKQLAGVASTSTVRLIVAIATPAAQAVVRTPTGIPILYGAVADPVGAGILASGRATGIRNAGPEIIAHALRFQRAAFPQARRIGVLYNPAEQNSVYVQGVLDSLAPLFGFQIVRRAVASPSAVAPVIQSLARDVDLIYSANDNTVNSAAATVAAVARSLRKPFVIGDLSTLDQGPFAAVGLHYGRMGNSLAHIAARLLLGEPVSAIAPVGPPTPEVWISGVVGRSIRATLPQAARNMVNRTLP